MKYVGACRALALLMMLVTQPHVDALAETQVIVITGSRYWSGGPGGGGVDSAGGPPRSADEVFEDDLAQEIAACYEKKADVRCVPFVDDDVRKTTSRSDPLARQMAAQAVFRSIPITQRKDALVGGFLRVRYADGGSEQWLVPSPSFSDGGINQPMPGTLKDGGGEIKETACEVV